LYEFKYVTYGMSASSPCCNTFQNCPTFKFWSLLIYHTKCRFGRHVLFQVVSFVSSVLIAPKCCHNVYNLFSALHGWHIFVFIKWHILFAVTDTLFIVPGECWKLAFWCVFLIVQVFLSLFDELVSVTLYSSLNSSCTPLVLSSRLKQILVTQVTH